MDTENKHKWSIMGEVNLLLQQIRTAAIKKAGEWSDKNILVDRFAQEKVSLKNVTVGNCTPNIYNGATRDTESMGIWKYQKFTSRAFATWKEIIQIDNVMSGKWKDVTRRYRNFVRWLPIRPALLGYPHIESLGIKRAIKE